MLNIIIDPIPKRNSKRGADSSIGEERRSDLRLGNQAMADMHASRGLQCET